jgi:hypothetical protein
VSKGCGHMSRPWPTYDSVRDTIVLRHRCVNCRNIMPLGPAAADTPEVAVEKRAAEIAGAIDDWTTRGGVFRGETANGDEIAGLIVWMYDSAKQPETGDEWSGYLAACIHATHDETETT